MGFDTSTKVEVSIKNKVVSQSYSVVSLFSGCGGLDLGFLGDFQSNGTYYEKLPFEITWANDISSAACKTYRHNLKHEIHWGDIWDAMDAIPKEADVVIGGFPCQDVSINGSRLAQDGVRTNLYKAMIEVVSRIRPRLFVAENVKGLLMSHSRAFYNQMISDFEDLGDYRISPRLYLAADYEVPQMRERIFIVGSRRPFAHPSKTLSEESYLTSEQALDDLEGLLEDRGFNHVWSKAAVSKDQGNRRLRADRPATTIRAECHGNNQFHYKLNRRISMREAARLQSFPDNFIFQSGLRETERQVGNAVPPVLAWHIAKAVQENLK